MLQYMIVIAESWPIAVMVAAITAGIVVRRSLKQAMDNSQQVRDLRASNAVTVRERDDR